MTFFHAQEFIARDAHVIDAEFVGLHPVCGEAVDENVGGFAHFAGEFFDCLYEPRDELKVLDDVRRLLRTA